LSTTPNTPGALRLRKLVFAALLAVICIAIVIGLYENRPWSIPQEAKLLKNPIQPSPEVLAAARSIYLDKCANCHGKTGKGDGPDAASYYPSPASLADSHRMNARTDGEIFYQISKGRKPMPSFQKRLTEEQRWQLVLYIRSLAAPASTVASK
jgi:mono/diheme cytochrome c family protein